MLLQVIVTKMVAIQLQMRGKGFTQYYVSGKIPLKTDVCNVLGVCKVPRVAVFALDNVSITDRRESHFCGDQCAESGGTTCQSMS